jgi:hypothetical protein
MAEPGDRPGWSFTWLLRVQRRHRTKPRPSRAGNGKGGTGFQWFSWIVLAALVIEVGVALYFGFLPK